jgi:hypothetical protein
MRLTTEEKQYLEIYLWNDYNEKMVIKKGDLKERNLSGTSNKTTNIRMKTKKCHVN